VNITGTATAYGSGVFQVTCPFNNTLYSCGVGNIQLSYADANRYAVPVSSTTCQCKETQGATCIAYCGNVKPSGYEIKNTTFTGNGTSACSAGKKVMSCGVAPTSNGIDLFRKAYPAANGQSCQCSYNFGAICFAVCADAPPNHEVVALIFSKKSFDYYLFTFDIASCQYFFLNFWPNTKEVHRVIIAIKLSSIVC
jgi:hypothetical protein